MTEGIRESVFDKVNYNAEINPQKRRTFLQKKWCETKKLRSPRGERRTI